MPHSPRGMHIRVTRGSVEQGGRGGQEGVAVVHGVSPRHALIALEPGLPAAVSQVIHAEPAAGAGVACNENCWTLSLCKILSSCSKF